MTLHIHWWFLRNIFKDGAFFFGGVAFGAWIVFHLFMRERRKAGC